MKAVGMGTLSLDVTRHTKGEMQRAGGSCANILMHLADMGWDCSMCHMEGDDEISEYTKADLNGRGVKSISMKLDSPTRILVIRSLDGSHDIRHACDHGKKIMSRMLVDESLASTLDPDCDAFIFDNAELMAAEFASRCTGLSWFETYGRDAGRPTWPKCVKAADVVKSAEHIAVPDGKIGILTHGADGMSYHWRGGVVSIPPVTPPCLVDACGCGDCVSACCIDAAANRSYAYSPVIFNPGEHG